MLNIFLKKVTLKKSESFAAHYPPKWRLWYLCCCQQGRHWGGGAGGRGICLLWFLEKGIFWGNYVKIDALKKSVSDDFGIFKHI